MAWSDQTLKLCQLDMHYDHAPVFAQSSRASKTKTSPLLFTDCSKSWHGVVSLSCVCQGLLSSGSMHAHKQSTPLPHVQQCTDTLIMPGEHRLPSQEPQLWQTAFDHVEALTPWRTHGHMQTHLSATEHFDDVFDELPLNCRFEVKLLPKIYLSRGMWL